MESKSLTKGVRVAWLATIMVTIALIASFFLPIVSMTKEYRADYEDAVEFLGNGAFGEIGLEAKQLTDISFAKFAKIFNILGKIYSDYKIISLLFVAFIVIAAVTLIFALAKLPVGVMIFDIIACLFTLLMTFVMKESIIAGAGKVYKLGVGFPIMYIIEVALFILSIYFIVEKSKMKKARKAAAASAAPTIE